MSSRPGIDGLTNTRQYPWRNWAFNFIQILSEIAQKNPELLVLVVSVREGNSDAYQQMHRVNPVVVDFKGPLAKRDRQRLLLYRIFDNRMQIPTAQITTPDPHPCLGMLSSGQGPPTRAGEADRRSFLKRGRSRRIC